MKVIKYILYGLFGLLFIGCFLPGSMVISCSTEINAPIDKVFSQVNHVKNWNHWSPWHALDPQAAYQYAEKAEGMGAWFAWQGKKVGTGKNTLIDTLGNTKLRFKVNFGSNDAGYAEFHFRDTLGKTQVKWNFDYDHAWNPVSRWMGVLFLNQALGEQYAEGLKRLKSYCEK